MHRFTILCISVLVFVEIGLSFSKPVSLQELVADIRKLQTKMNSKLPRSLRSHSRRSTSVSHQNLCREETVTVNLQDLFGTKSDIFFPREIVKVRCASKGYYRPRGYPTCNNGDSDCVTKKRRVWFMRRPKHLDCRFARMESLMVETGCECQTPIHSG